MKNYKIPLISILILSIIFFIVDKQLFYYGKNDFDIYNLLPMGIKPEFRPDYEGGFALRDKYGFTIIAKNNTYEFKEETIKINKVIKYGYRDEKLLAVVEDINNTKLYVETLLNNDVQSGKNIMVNIWDENKVFEIEDYKWVEIKNNESYINELELIGNYIMFIIFILFLTLIYTCIKNIFFLDG